MLPMSEAIHLNVHSHTPWLDKVLKITFLEWLKMHSKILDDEKNLENLLKNRKHPEKYQMFPKNRKKNLQKQKNEKKDALD